VAVLAHLHRYFGFDLSIALALQHLRSAPLDVLMKAASWPGYSPQFVPEFALVLLAFLLLRLRIEAVIMTLAEVGVAVQGFVLKPIVGRPRPSTGLIWVNDRLREDPYTFTAGHVHTFTVIFGFVAFLAWRRMRPGDWRRTAIIAGSVLVLVVVGISRIYLGDHWASDVLGGYLAGGIWLGVAILLHQSLFDRGIIRAADR
jgi:undecaprenyl-diphosphatase